MNNIESGLDVDKLDYLQRDMDRALGLFQTLNVLQRSLFRLFCHKVNEFVVEKQSVDLKIIGDGRRKLDYLQRDMDRALGLP